MDSLLALFKAEPFSKEFEINGVKLHLRVLTSKEYDEIMSRAKISLNDLVSKRAMIKRPILGYSIVSLNGVRVEDFKEIKESLKIHKDKKEDLPINLIVEEFLGELDTLTIDAFYSLYEELEEEKSKSLEEIKKA